LFQDHRYVVAHYIQAPGVSEGTPVRKSGIRVGEVVAIQFDDRPEMPDGVLVTLSIESRYKIRAGSVPRITRGLIGDVAIDLEPGTSLSPMAMSPTPAGAMDHVIEGAVAPDPSHALASAAEAFENVKTTLAAIEGAANGLQVVMKKAEDFDQLVESFSDMGRSVSTLATRLDKVVGANESEIGPMVASLRSAADRVNETLDPETQKAFKTTARQLASGSARLDRILTEVGPLATDLGSNGETAAKTAFGQTVQRLNRVAYDVSMLTREITDGKGHLNRDGSLQRLLTDPELYNRLNAAAASAGRVVGIAERVVANVNRFAERIANDPSVLGRGVLAPR
jgi:phospholipid/cholesterol/gamma-HCH transport system substrate-binding protein